jgi:hypothetical protein
MPLYTPFHLPVSPFPLSICKVFFYPSKFGSHSSCLVNLWNKFWLMAPECPTSPTFCVVLLFSYCTDTQIEWFIQRPAFPTAWLALSEKTWHAIQLPLPASSSEPRADATVYTWPMKDSLNFSARYRGAVLYATVWKDNLAFKNPGLWNISASLHSRLFETA